MTPAPADSPGPPAPESPTPPPPPADHDALARALAATRRAEEIQRQSHQQNAVERVIGSMPVPDTAKDWLRRNPQYVTDPRQNAALSAAHFATIEAMGGDNDKIGSPEYLAALEQNIAGYWQHQRAAEQQHENVEELSHASREAARIDRAVENLEHDAAQYRQEMTPPPPAAAPLAPAAPPVPPIVSERKGVPVSAPVSRDIPMPSGQRTSESSKITLTAEERDMAHKSMNWLPPHEAEVAYAINKQKMQRMKANGEIV